MSMYINAVKSALEKASAEYASTPCGSAILAISCNPYFTELGKERFITNIKNKYYYIIDEATGAIRTAYNEYVKRLDNVINELKENGCLDSNDLLLLSSSIISLSESDFLKIAEKHKNNYAMYEAISNYAKLHQMRCPITYINRNEKIEFASSIRNEAVRKLNSIFYMPIRIDIKEEVKKILVE